MILLKNGLILQKGVFVTSDVLIDGENIIDISPVIFIKDKETKVIDCSGKWIREGAVDSHVHLREPGYSHKETVKSGTLAAAKGGVTTLFAMPNLQPVPDCKENLQVELDIIKKDAVVNVLPYLSVTKGQEGKELSEMCVDCTDAIAYSEDGKNVSNLGLLHDAMVKAKEQEAVIASHAEAIEFSDSRKQEYMAVRRELALANNIGCKYHFCHISTKDSLDEIRRAKRWGGNISCEITPHHFALCEDDIENTNFKMNPPLRPESDRLACIEAIKDGTVDMLSTDHAPHTEEEKNVDYVHAPNGIIGLETFLPIAYTLLVDKKIVTPQRFVELTATNAQARFGLPVKSLAVGETADICVLDINNEREYTKEEIVSIGKNSPFIGKKYKGFNVLTIVDGKIVYCEI